MAGHLKSGRQWLGVALIATICVLTALDATAERKAKRILLVGDSWPYFMYTGATFWNGCAAQDGVDQAGYTDWAVFGGDTAVPMSMAREWRDNLSHSYMGHASFLLDIVRDVLLTYPTIDIVHMSLGGNDIGRGYYNDVMPQQIRFTGTPTGGTYTLTFEGQVTTALPYNATAAQIQAALEALSNIGAGKIEVTGSDGGPYMCVFDSSIVGYIGSSTADNNLSASSSIEGGSIAIDEAHHGWEKSWGIDSDYEKLFFQAVCAAIEKVVKVILDTRPDIRVTLCDYDYLRVNWGGTSDDRAGMLETRWTGMRLGLAKFNLMQGLSATTEYRNRCYFLSPAGLMQYTFGLYSRYNYCAVGSDASLGCTESDIGPAPGAVQLYGPNGTAGTAGTVPRPLSNLAKWSITQPVLGGDIDPPIDYYPDDRPDPTIADPHTCDISSRSVILADIGGGDIHLNSIGYAALMKYGVEEYYGEWMDLPRVLSVTHASSKSINPDILNEKSTATLAAFQVKFSENVTGVDESDFQAVTHGTRVGASIVSVNPGPAGYYDTYIVTVDCGSGKGTVTVDVIDNGTIKDQDENALEGDISGYYSSGELVNPSSTALPVAALPAVFILAGLGAWTLKRRGC